MRLLFGTEFPLAQSSVAVPLHQHIIAATSLSELLPRHRVNLKMIALRAGALDSSMLIRTVFDEEGARPGETAILKDESQLINLKSE